MFNPKLFKFGIPCKPAAPTPPPNPGIPLMPYSQPNKFYVPPAVKAYRFPSPYKPARLLALALSYKGIPIFDKLLGLGDF